MIYVWDPPSYQPSLPILDIPLHAYSHLSNDHNTNQKSGFILACPFVMAHPKPLRPPWVIIPKCVKTMSLHLISTATAFSHVQPMIRGHMSPKLMARHNDKLASSIVRFYFFNSFCNSITWFSSELWGWHYATMSKSWLEPVHHCHLPIEILGSFHV